MLSSPLLWTSLYHGPNPPFCDTHSPSGFLGDAQPSVRRASWGLLSTLLKIDKHHTISIEGHVVETMGRAVLRSAWVEPDRIVRNGMWEPLLSFLTSECMRQVCLDVDSYADDEGYPSAWDSSARQTSPNPEEEDDSNDSSDESDKESEDENPVSAKPLQPSEDNTTTSKSNPAAYKEFLTFLSLGCYGSPLEGYPTLVVILSTLPPSIISPSLDTWTDFLDSLWAALDGGALSTGSKDARRRNVDAFLEAVLECVVGLVRRWKGQNVNVIPEEAAVEKICEVVKDQTRRVWQTLTSSKAGSMVDEKVAGKALAGFLRSLGNAEDSK